MKLANFLINHKDTIIKCWFDMIIDTYPDQSAKYLSKKDNSFANPIGSITADEIALIFDNLLEPNKDFNVKDHLEPIVRMRAVQDFTASQAVEFIFFLKSAVKQVLKNKKILKELSEELLDFEQKIDKLMLLGFDLYVDAKVILAEMKAGQENRTWGKMVERLNKKYDYVDKQKDFDSKENSN